jgi:MFS family permease
MQPPLSANPDFWRLWFVGMVAFVVRWLEMLAIGLYAYQLTGSAFVVAVLSMMRVLPKGLFGAVLGAAAERIERHSALVLMAAISIIGASTLAMLASFDALRIWHLGLVSFVNGVCWAADNPVRRMMIGDVVGPERMGAAMSIDAGTNNASRVLGPTLSGVLLAQAGIATVFWLGAVLYTCSLVAALKIRVRSGRSGIEHAPFFASIRQGLAWARTDRRIIGVFLITICFNVFGWPYTSMIPVFGTDYLHLGPEGVGLVASCEGIGGLIGALLVAWLGRPQWYGRIYVGAVVSYLVMAIAFALSSVVTVAAIVLLLSGTLSTGFAVMQATLVYRITPPQMRARLLGVLSVCIGTSPIGFLYLGWLAHLFAPRAATVALGMQGLLVLLLTRRYWLPALRPS